MGLFCLKEKQRSQNTVGKRKRPWKIVSTFLDTTNSMKPGQNCQQGWVDELRTTDPDHHSRRPRCHISQVWSEIVLRCVTLIGWQRSRLVAAVSVLFISECNSSKEVQQRTAVMSLLRLSYLHLRTLMWKITTANLPLYTVLCLIPVMLQSFSLWSKPQYNGIYLHKNVFFPSRATTNSCLPLFSKTLMMHSYTFIQKKKFSGHWLWHSFLVIMTLNLIILWNYLAMIKKLSRKNRKVFNWNSFLKGS